MRRCRVRTPTSPPVTVEAPIQAAAPVAPSLDSAAPAAPTPPGPRVVEIALGAEFTCARTERREVYCWGENNRGQIGDGTTQNQAKPVRVSLPGSAEQIGAGNYHACARLEDGTVWCWGSRTVGEVGDGSRGEEPSPRPREVAGLGVVARVDVGEGTSCAAKPDASVWCWGAGYDAIGHGNAAPAPAPALRGAVRIGLGPVHGCAMLDGESAVRCWADASPFLLLGDPKAKAAASPVRVPGLPPARSISARAFRTCAVTEGGDLYCWGADLGASTPSPLRLAVPARVPGLSGVRSVAVQIHHVCAVLDDRTVSCLGENRDGRLGDGTMAERTDPRRVRGLRDVEEVDVGEHHSCARTTSGALFCWGGNEDGQIGDGTGDNRLLPVEIRL